mgnify:CR=1 FL=1
MKKEIGNLVINMVQDRYFTIGDDIKITLVDISGKQVRIRIEAPKDIAIARSNIKTDIDKIATTWMEMQ